MNVKSKREREAVELEAIQQKLVNNQPLTVEEREECYWGLYGRINSLRSLDPPTNYERPEMKQ